MVEVARQRPPLGDQARPAVMALVVDALAVGVAVSTPDGRLVEVNDALLELVGCPRSQALGRTLDELLGSDLAVSRSSAGPDRQVRTFERYDGRQTWVRVTATQLAGETPLTVHALEDLTELMVHEGELRERALRDPVTGLPNRYLFQDRLDHALAMRARGGPEIAVVFVDLDGFKRVNDTAGHLAGDDVLREAGRRIASCGRVSDTVARWAGDEFVVLLDGVGDAGDAERMTDRIAAVCAEPFVVGHHVLTLGASVGLALTAGPAVDAADLVDEADRAMYAHKHRRR